MDAFASAKSQRSMLTIVSAALGACGLLFFGGCCHDDKDKTADDTSPPPQSLSEPVKPPVSTPALEPALPPAIPVSVDEYTAQKPGETKELPVFVAPSASIPTPVATERIPEPGAAAPVLHADQRDANGRYHVLQKDETLYGLARQYNVKAKKIIEANQFNDPNRLVVGTKVYIPD